MPEVDPTGHSGRAATGSAETSTMLSPAPL